MFGDKVFRVGQCNAFSFEIFLNMALTNCFLEDLGGPEKDH